jgi:hypothetical protein
MILWRLGVIFLLVVSSSCDCSGDVLKKACPIPEQLGKSCLINEEGGWELINPQEIDWEITSPSLCRLGETKCDETIKEIYCAGFVNSVEESCNEIDDDCDGQVDEGLNLGWNDISNNCSPGLGDCEKADKVCISGQYSCRYIGTPTEEICDGIDNDCNGVIDNIEPVDCWDGPEEAVLDGTTPCRMGLSFCLEGSWNQCIGSIIPSEEVCDLADNNCNGQIDLDAVTNNVPCGPTSILGECILGTEQCINGESQCLDAVYEQNEGCDGADNDCDGQVDENLWQPCSTECGVGIEECDEGQWINCTAQQPSLEICDGADNDCDTEIDEGCPCIHNETQSCSSNIVDANGILLDPQCGIGVQLCEWGEWSECEFWGTFPETCNNWDDDCENGIDNFSVVCGDSETAGVGLCKLGESTCMEGRWRGCEGVIYPEEEVCDQEDNNCNGLVDEGLDPDEKVDMVFVIDISGSMGSYIDALKVGIDSYVNDFQNTEHLFALVVYGLTPDNHHEVWTTPSLVDVGNFVSTLSGVNSNGSSIEPTYDVLKDLVSSSDPLNIGWREDATPYIIVMTDENAQTMHSNSEFNIAPSTFNCELGNCEPGDSIEIFVITRSVYFGQYDQIVYGEQDRLININPVNENRYTIVLREIFQNVCLFDP